MEGVPQRHPCSGTTLLSEFQKNIADKFKELNVNQKLAEFGSALHKAARVSEDGNEEAVNPMKQISGVFNQLGNMLRRGRST